MKNKILFINNFYNPGGSSLACLEIAKQFKDKYIMNFVGCYLGSLISEFDKYGIVFYGKELFHEFNYDNKALYVYNDEYNHITDLDQIIYGLDPDIIHVFIPGHENPSYFKKLSKLKCKKVCTILCGQEIGFDSNIFDRIIFPSKYNRNLSTKKEIKNSTIVRYGIDLPSKPLKIEKLFNKKSPTFGRISAFCPSKKIIDTLRCAEKHNSSQFIIAGEIQDYQYYNYICREASKLNNVQILTNISDQIKREILEKIDILHYPSSNEAFCYSILEGMAYSKPIITYNSSAIPEFVEGIDSHGFFIVKNEDIIELNNATSLIIDLFKNKPAKYLQMCRDNYKIYKNQYTSDIYAKEIESVYNSI